MESAGITVKKTEDISEWYTQVVIKSEMADYSLVSGCIIFRPLSYAIWENIREFFDSKIKATGHKNVYFPLFIPESLFKKEAEHVAGFTPEVAWVTHAGNSQLHERLAIRPTSETIMYDSYSKWIRSWRDLPLLLNQWNNVVRWEFANPKPFLRTREFLWQEGHTVHETNEECEKEVMMILSFYKEVMEKLLAIPVIDGKKSESEKFAGALFTTGIESLMPDGKALQMGTSHNLGQNFSKAFNISFLGKDKAEHHAWQSSWGISTRVIGAMILLHGDDKGLILPPNVAPTQAVIVPIYFDKNKTQIIDEANKILNELKDKVRIELDIRDGYTPGFKFNDWEMKGVPIRIEFGPKDLEKGQAVIVLRDTNEKKPYPLSELAHSLKEELKHLQKRLFDKAKKVLEEKTTTPHTFAEFTKAIEDKNMPFSFHCAQPECEAKIKEETQATTRIIPFNQHSLEHKKCIRCAEPAKYQAYFAKNY